MVEEPQFHSLQNETMSSIEKKRNKFGSSFSNSLRNSNADDLEQSFKVGDFSTKHLRRSSVQTQKSLNRGLEFTPDSPNLKKIEGGFEDRTTWNDSLKSNGSTRDPISGLTNKISSSLKNDSRVFESSQNEEAATLSKPPAALNQLIFSDGSPVKSASAVDLSLRSVSPAPGSKHPEVDIKNPNSSTVEVVGRHLVNENDASSVRSKLTQNDDFDSLLLQGGDISREVYNWQKEHSQGNKARRRTRSFSGSFSANGSFSGSTTEPDFQVQDIRIPGGFRRSFLVQKASRKNLINGPPPTFFTRNFIEFLTLYGHFAGEELRDEDDLDEYEADNDEESLLLPSVSPSAAEAGSHKTTTTTKAVLLLVKAFIGTGVLFLPRGFRNGGWLFSTIALVVFAILSYWCFLLLINVRVHLKASSYGEVGEKLFGAKMRQAILASIVLSQIGFAAAYIVFTATNLRAFFTTVFNVSLGLEFYILIQLVIFTPLSLTRKISKLSGTALIADLFIFIGLLYVYYYCSFVIIEKGIAPIKTFNKDWSVFIGTAIFTYEGIGLLIPIQESMKKPSKFPTILGWVMFTATIAFISAGLVGYLSFGSATETVILLNFDNSIFVSAVQFLYSIAILLSTPLQLFPAIRILENALIKKSGKYDTSIKWKKNYFRVLVVFLTSLVAWGGASDLDKFVAIVGSFACIPLIYIFPPLLHYVSLADTTFSKVSDLIMLLLGLTMMSYTSFQTIKDWIN